VYAIVKTGGKQYRVTPGQWLRVERLRADEGEAVSLTPLLVVDGERVVDGPAASEASVTARVLAHERGPKLRVVKFKPKRGYRRRNGHRQQLTRIRIEAIRIGPAEGSATTESSATESSATGRAATGGAVAESSAAVSVAAGVPVTASVAAGVPVTAAASSGADGEEGRGGA
jgi:large subunit ribosomal protein L21